MSVMIQIENLSETGLKSVLMNLSDLILHHCQRCAPGEGMELFNDYITPEGCYWLYQFLRNGREVHVSSTTLALLKNGTNHPELL